MTQHEGERANRCEACCQKRQKSSEEVKLNAPSNLMTRATTARSSAVLPP